MVVVADKSDEGTGDKQHLRKQPSYSAVDASDYHAKISSFSSLAHTIVLTWLGNGMFCHRVGICGFRLSRYTL